MKKRVAVNVVCDLIMLVDCGCERLLCDSKRCKTEYDKEPEVGGRERAFYQWSIQYLASIRDSMVLPSYDKL